jgi:hypothetical protein
MVSLADDPYSKKSAPPPPSHNTTPPRPASTSTSHGSTSGISHTPLNPGISHGSSNSGISHNPGITIPGGLPRGAPRPPAANVPRGPTPEMRNTTRPETHPAAGFAAGHPARPAGEADRASESRAESNTYRSFATHPIPAGREEARTASGAVIHTRSDGSRADFHDAHRGMDIHYGLNGSRRVVTDRPDHSRVFAERGGHGYVQHPYLFRGQEFAHRTYFDHGHEFVRVYGRYPYHGVNLEVYTPVTYYSVGFYGWVDTPWGEPVHYAWQWRGSPWYRYYGYYFVPYPVYSSAPLWLTDYLIATSLQAAYAAQVRAQMAAGAYGAPVVSPEVKEEIAEEVRLEVQQETAAARASAGNPHWTPDDGGISVALSDGHSHVFVAGGDLDLVGGGGDECTLSQGDVVQVRAAPAPGAQAVNATVLASKGGTECAPDTSVRVALTDLQEMQNYMRQTVEQGMADLQAKQGTANLPAAPATALGAAVSTGFASNLPPPDANAATEIAEQATAADQAEREETTADAR